MELVLSKQCLLLIFLIAMVSESTEKETASSSDLSHQKSDRTVLDLLKDLDNSSLSSVRVKRLRGQPNALRLDSPNRSLTVRDAAITKVLRLLREFKGDFVVLFTLLQMGGNTGTLLALSSGDSFYFEMESDGHKNEIRLHYSRKGKVRVKVFPYDLADGKWHKLALTVSGKTASLFVDCNRIYKRTLKGINKLVVPESETRTLFIGQRNQHEGMLTGALHEVKFVTRVEGFVLPCANRDEACSFCPKLQGIENDMKKMSEKNINRDEACSFCPKFQDIENDMKNMSKKNKQLDQTIKQAEAQIRDLGKQNCLDNVTTRISGEVWTKEKCTECKCYNGTMECHTQTTCPNVNCSNPLYLRDECCPHHCKSNCLFASRYYDNGEDIIPSDCVKCKCQDGRVECKKQFWERDCPKLNCTKKDWIQVHGQCCPVCKPTGLCARRRCHVFAKCVGERQYCQCLHGFTIDNVVECKDVDECDTNDRTMKHQCEDTANCVNMDGSYQCVCKQGYSRVDNYSPCIDIDECNTFDQSERHTCYESEICVNTPGSFRCECKEGDHRIGKNTCAGPTPPEAIRLAKTCSSAEMQQRIKHDCETGNLRDCEITDTKRPDLNLCQTSYTCSDVHYLATNDTMKCLLLCALMTHSARRPVSDFWKYYKLITTRRIHVKQYVGDHKNHTIENNDDDFTVTNRTYEFFHDLQWIERATITTLVDGCPGDLGKTPFDGGAICRHTPGVRSLDLERDKADDYMNRKGKFRHSFARYDYCSRHYAFRMEKILIDNNGPSPDWCNDVLWMFKKVFTDIPEGNTSDNTKYDVIFSIDYASIITPDSPTTKLIAVSARTAMSVLFTDVDRILRKFSINDIGIHVKLVSRNCFLERPVSCKRKDYERFLPFSNDVCRKIPRFSPNVERALKISENDFSPECAVRVSCDFSKDMHFVRRSRDWWCVRMDSMFNTSMEWLSNARSDIQSYMALLIEGKNKDYVKDFIAPKASLKPLFDRFMTNAAYGGDKIYMYTVFNNCMLEINDDALIKPNGKYVCAKTVFWSTPSLPADNCQYDPADILTQGTYNKTFTATCSFNREDDVNRRCEKLNWMVYPMYLKQSVDFSFRTKFDVIINATSKRRPKNRFGPISVERAYVARLIKNVLFHLSIPDLTVLKIVARHITKLPK